MDTKESHFDVNTFCTLPCRAGKRFERVKHERVNNINSIKILTNKTWLHRIIVRAYFVVRHNEYIKRLRANGSSSLNRVQESKTTEICFSTSLVRHVGMSVIRWIFSVEVVPVFFLRNEIRPCFDKIKWYDDDDDDENSHVHLFLSGELSNYAKFHICISVLWIVVSGGISSTSLIFVMLKKHGHDMSNNFNTRKWRRDWMKRKQ